MQIKMQNCAIFSYQPSAFSRQHSAFSYQKTSLACPNERIIRMTISHTQLPRISQSNPLNSPSIAIEGAVGDGLEDMLALDIGAAFEVGNSARHL